MGCICSRTSSTRVSQPLKKNQIFHDSKSKEISQQKPILAQLLKPKPDFTISKFSIEGIQSSISKSYEEIKAKANVTIENSLILLGRTGSGKSTLVNYLMEIPLKAREISNTFLIETDITNRDYSVISHGTVSQTVTPVTYQLQDLIVWDTPGFIDNRGPEFDIPNCYSIQGVFKMSRFFKIAIVVQESHIINQRSNKFIDILKDFMNFFEDIDIILPGVILEVTQVRDIESENALAIELIRDDILLNHPNYHEDLKKLLTIFTNPEKILFFKRPVEEGLISFDERKVMLKKVKNLTFLQKLT